MAANRTQVAQQNGPLAEEDEAPPPRYFISQEEAELRHRSLPLLISSKRCYACKQGDEEEPQASSDVQQYIDRIAEHCGQASDYLLPDTPSKEAIFRVILAGGNEPMTAQEISQILSEKWALTAYPRDASPRVIRRLLDHSGSYCIARVPEPEVEAEESVEEESAETTEEEASSEPSTK